MKILFLSNFFTPHQKPISDELYKLLGEGNYFFVSTEVFSEERKQMGWQEMTAPYVLHYEGENKTLVDNLVRDFDVVILGDAPLSIVKNRYLSGKLTICNNERRYKTISRYLKYPINTYKSFYTNKGYLLASSAFAPKDFFISGMSLKKCFRWGYFTELKEYENIDKLIADKGCGIETPKGVSILWAGRLIGLKHPEAPIQLAKILRDNGISFRLNIIGNGILENKLLSLIKKYNIGEYVHLLGSMSPEKVRVFMEKSDIYLFTSDRHEGWGAVLNESMNSACAVVASNAIGSVPYLIKDGQNGMKYQSGNVKDLYDKVKLLIDNPTMRNQIQKAAYLTMINVWSPQNAANNLILLLTALLQGKSSPITDGPGSPAPLVLDKWLV